MNTKAAKREFNELYPNEERLDAEGLYADRRQAVRRQSDRMKHLGWAFFVHEFSMFVVGAIFGALVLLMALYWRIHW